MECCIVSFYKEETKRLVTIDLKIQVSFGNSTF